jgi:glycosyltransferase involved in cell wall biosynthesis
VKQEVLAILIPCYNEEKSIAKVINKIPKEKIKQLGLVPKILVINNNSTDKTREEALRAGATVIDEHKKGKGNAMRRGFSSLPDDTAYVVMLDGDDTYNPKEITRLVEPLQSKFCKVIIGSRLSGRMTPGAMNIVSRAGNWFFTHLVRSTHNVAVTDVLTGYFAWTRDAIEDLTPHLKSAGFAIEMEMITKMARMGYGIYSVPISYTPRIGESNLNPISDGTRILSMYAQTLRWRPRFGRKKEEQEMLAKEEAPQS